MEEEEDDESYDDEYGDDADSDEVDDESEFVDDDEEEKKEEKLEFDNENEYSPFKIKMVNLDSGSMVKKLDSMENRGMVNQLKSSMTNNSRKINYHLGSKDSIHKDDSIDEELSAGYLDGEEGGEDET